MSNRWRHRHNRHHNRHNQEVKDAPITFHKDPISTTGPTKINLENDVILYQILKKHDLLEESYESSKARQNVLAELWNMVKDWAIRLGKERNRTRADCRVKLYTFGSYRWGTHNKSDDIDVLVVVPQFINSHVFFTQFGQVLQEHPQIVQYNPVPKAFVATMSFKFRGIEMDLIFAHLNINVIPENWDIHLDENLKHLEQSTIWALNGPRVGQKLLDCIPKNESETGGKCDIFRMAVRAIKHWAKRRKIYGNKFGYLGGIAWGILVARICQLYPNATFSTIIQRFFLFYHLWDFDGSVKAILLAPIEKKPNIGCKVWSPVDGRQDIMNIITPAYPYQNSTHNVSNSQFRVIQEELGRGYHLLCGKTNIDYETLEELFTERSFFIDHAYYFWFYCYTPVNKCHKSWAGMIGSKIRTLLPPLGRAVQSCELTLFPEVFHHDPPSKKTLRKVRDPTIQQQIDDEKDRKKKKKNIAIKKKNKVKNRIKREELERQIKIKKQNTPRIKQETVVITLDDSDGDGDDDVQFKKSTKVIKTNSNYNNIKSIVKYNNNIKSEYKNIKNENNNYIKSEFNNNCNDGYGNGYNNGVLNHNNIKQENIKQENIKSENIRDEDRTEQVRRQIQQLTKYSYVAPEYYHKIAAAKMNNKDVVNDAKIDDVSNNNDHEKKPDKEPEKKENIDYDRPDNPDPFVQRRDMYSQPTLHDNAVTCCKHWTPQLAKVRKEHYDCHVIVIGMDKKGSRASTFPVNLKGCLQQWMENNLYWNHHNGRHVIFKSTNFDKVPHYFYEKYGWKRPDPAVAFKHRVKLWNLKAEWSKKKLSTPDANETENTIEKMLNNSNDKDFVFDMTGDKKEKLAILPGITDMNGIVGQKRESSNIKDELIQEQPNKKRKIDNIIDTLNAIHDDDDDDDNNNIEEDIDLKPKHIYYDDCKKIHKKYMVCDDSDTAAYMIELKMIVNAKVRPDPFRISAVTSERLRSETDQVWKKRFIKILENPKYQWNGVKFGVPLEAYTLKNLVNDVGKAYKEYRSI